MKKKIIWCLAVLLAAVFVWMPFPASDLYVRIYFDEIAGDSCSLYYGTDVQGSFVSEQCIHSEIDHDANMAEFRLDSSLYNHLTGLRLDLPKQLEQLLCIKNISVSSGGVIRKEYNPCTFFAPENLSYTNETTISLVSIRDRVYIQTGGNDPYLILSQGLTADIHGLYSRRRLSRLFLCLFVAGSYLLTRRKLFH